MARVYIALDLETTGLDAKTDRITEVGAVRFKGSRVFEEFHSLVNPGRSIPYQIQQLTGISNADVAQAPPFEAIRAALKRFVGDSPIVGHNIGFDLKFLGKYGLFKQNAPIDTFELASILLPHADRYSLGALAKLLGIEEPATHRALDDARVSHLLFEALQDQARRLDGNIIKEVSKLGARSKWSLTPVFQDLARERTSSSFGSLAQQLSAQGGLDVLMTEVPDLPSLRPIKPPRLLDETELASTLEKEGQFDKAFPHFEHRPQQVTMLKEVTNAFNAGYHLLVEAGTGTGKSMAYLLPAIHWAVQNESRVLISTNTINLQDQILQKDLPDLQKAIDVDFRATALKGRANYICPRRLEQLRRKPNLSAPELRVLAKIAVWLPNTLTGDRQELFMPDYAEQAIWSQVNSNPDFCRPDRCTPQTCFFARARHIAESAHVIVVNHALLLADISVNNRAIPEYDYLVVDEAHHLEDNVTKQLSFLANRNTMTQILTELGRPRASLFAEIERSVKKGGQVQAISQAATLSNRGRQMAQKAAQAWDNLFDVLHSFIQQTFAKSRNQYDRKLRLARKVRHNPAWSNVELAWDNANLVLSDVIASLKQAHKLWDGLDSYAVEDWEETILSISNYRAQVEEIKQNVSLILGEDNDDTITWIEEKIDSGELSLHAAPLHVGSLVRKHLFESKTSVVLTSATLRTDNTFDYIKDRLDAWDAAEIAVGSPFDYPNSTMLYIPTDMPEPNAHTYQKSFEETIVAVAKATKGRMLVLFTSYNHLRTTAQNTRKALAEADIVVYQQGTGSGRRQMLANFKSTDQAVLMGTRSFWEGVDVPGKSLSCVVIAKIPFAVPSDPIFQARSETFDNAFAQYSIPEAILHFRQGFGRLIRRKTDIGVVVVMDKRVLSKGYGRTFIESLPEITLKQGLASDLPALAADWIDADEL